MITPRDKFIGVGFSALFVAILYKFSYPVPIFRYLALAFLSLLLTLAGYYYWRFSRLAIKFFWPIVLILLSFSVMAFAFFVMPNRFLQLSFLLIASSILTFQQISAFLPNGGSMANRVTINSFVFFIAISAAAHYYFRFSGIIYPIAVLSFVWVLTRATYEYTPLAGLAKNINALIMAFLTTQVFWVTSFLPFHYSVIGLLNFNVFYVLWQWDYAYIFQKLQIKQIIFNIVFIVILTLIVLLFTPWRVMI